MEVTKWLKPSVTRPVARPVNFVRASVGDVSAAYAVSPVGPMVAVAMKLRREGNGFEDTSRLLMVLTRA